MIIDRYPISLLHSQYETYKLPVGAEIVHFGTENIDGYECLVFYVLVDPALPKVERCLRVVQSGDELRQHFKYIGTCQTCHHVVYHLVEVV